MKVTTDALQLAQSLESSHPEAAAALRAMQSELEALRGREGLLIERCAVQAWMTGMVCR